MRKCDKQKAKRKADQFRRELRQELGSRRTRRDGVKVGLKAPPKIRLEALVMKKYKEINEN